MTRILAVTALALLFPTMAAADLYRCKQTDGNTRFQDQPCGMGATGPGKSPPATGAETEYPLKVPGFSVYRPAPPAPAAAESPPAEDRTDAMNREIEAYNRKARCSNARHRLGVLSEERPVYRYDDKGERQYLDDDSRARETAEARQGVSRNCK